MRTFSSRRPVTRLLWVARLPDVRHAAASVTFPYHASHGWFSSSPFSLSVLENHKETPCCSWNSCQRDSSGIEHMEPSVSLHKQRCCYFQLSGLLSLPAWVPPWLGERGQCVCVCDQSRRSAMRPACLLMFTLRVLHGESVQGWQAWAVE